VAKLRILVVEDHPMTARGLKMFLQLEDYEVKIAGDVKSALKEASTFKFDLLVCDLSLPDGTGWDLMKTLSQQAPVRGIAFSAFDEPQHRAQSKDAGFLEHIVKGSTPEELLAAIARAFGQDRTGAEKKPQ
jgi:DNA-binding response OmpR family regulator